MCTGTTTAFTCGHLITHFSTRCPQNCAVPTTPVTFVQDTCAPCHPEHRIREAKRRYAKQLAVYSFQIAQADLKEDHALAYETRQKMQDLHAAYLEEVAAARRVGRGCAEVVWPGKKDEGEEEEGKEEEEEEDIWLLVGE